MSTPPADMSTRSPTSILEEPSPAGRRTAVARAALRVTAAVGYDAATVTEIAEEAGCSRRGFNRHFRDKAAAFEAGYLEITRDLRRTVQEACDAHDGSMQRAWACIEALAEFLASDPRRAELLVIHGHAAGPGTVEIHAETMRGLVDLILDNTRHLPRSTGDPRMVAEMVAGGIHEVIFTRTLRGQVEMLPALVPDWVPAVVAPYVAIATIDPWARPR